MSIRLWEIKIIITDIGGGLGNFFKMIGNGIFEMLSVTFRTARYILYKVLCVILAITNICFLIGLFFLYLNIREAMNGIPIIDTSRFIPMLFLCISHIVMFVICMIVRPKY